MKNNILGISLMGMALAMPVATASAQWKNTGEVF